MKKLTLITFFLLMLNIYGKTQQITDSVQMKYVYSIEEALKKAQKEKKPIFFNCFANWALPCHGMNQFVFNNKEFADYMDQHFVNLFVEMVETPEGKALAEKYNVNTYAQYLVLDESGRVILRIIGGSKLPDFQKKISMALNSKTTLPGMLKRYESGERNLKFLREYAEMVKDADMEKEYNIVKEEFFTRVKESELCKKENWTILSREAQQVEDKMLQFIIKNKAAFIKNIGEETINNRIANVYTLEIYPYASGSKTYDPKVFEQLTDQIPNLDLPKDKQLFVISDIARYRGEKQYDQMMDVLEKQYTRLDKEVLPALNLSLSEIRDYSSEQKKRVTAYLQEQMEKTKGSVVKHYANAIDKVLHFAGIVFENGTFQEILTKAEKENKSVFIDCYTSWCAPCRTMSDQVFTTKQVGDVFNKNFINAKIDMEKGEGIDLAKKYGISSYPTFLIVDHQGNIVHKVIGAIPPDVFIERMLRGLNPETAYTSVKTKYDNGEHSIELMSAYFQAMQDAGELPESEKTIENYLTGLTIEQRCHRASWNLFTTSIQDNYNPLFTDFLKNKETFEKALGKQEVYKKIENIYFPILLKHLAEPSKKSELDKTMATLNTVHLPANSTLSYLQKMISLYGQKNYDSILSVYENDIINLENPHDRLNLDVLLTKLLNGASAEQNKKALVYVQKCLKNADSRAMNGYKKLIESLNR